MFDSTMAEALRSTMPKGASAEMQKRPFNVCYGCGVDRVTQQYKMKKYIITIIINSNK